MSWGDPDANPLGDIRAAIDRAQVRFSLEQQEENARRARWREALDYVSAGNIEDPNDPIIRKITAWATYGVGPRPW